MTAEGGKPRRPTDIPTGKEAHIKIAPTAIMTARMRTFTDLPFSRRIYEIVAAKWEAAGNQPVELIEPKRYVPPQEIRPRLVDQLIAAGGNTQILDLGAGLIYRGAAMTATDPKITYVEVDVPEMTRLKKEIIEELQTSDELPRELPNLHIEAGNILDGKALMDIVLSRLTPGQPVDIVMEGVLHYLTIPRSGDETRENQRRVLIENIKRIFDYTGGGRIITDMPVQRPEEREREGNIAKVTGAITGVDITGNRFDTNDEAMQFFADLGLEITQQVPFNSIVDDLKSPERIGVTREEVLEENAPWFMWVLEPASDK